MRYSQVFRASVCLLGFTAIGALVRAQQPIVPNGDMSEGFITSTSDTMPNGWGSTACFGTAPTTVCMRFDQTDFQSAPASMRIDQAGGDHVYTRGISNVTPAEGGNLILTGKLKVTNPTGLFRVALASGCGGGGWTQTAYVQVVRQDTESPWYTFQGQVAVQTAAYCQSVQRSYAAVTIHVFWAAGATGTAWLDDLQAYANSIPIRVDLVRPENTQAVRIENNAVRFDRDANYRISVVSADGRTQSTIKGVGRDAILFSGRAAPGVYVVSVQSDVGNMSRTLTLASTGR